MSDIEHEMAGDVVGGEEEEDVAEVTAVVEVMGVAEVVVAVHLVAEDAIIDLLLPVAEEGVQLVASHGRLAIVSPDTRQVEVSTA
jgi:hypothetical protein